MSIDSLFTQQNLHQRFSITQESSLSYPSNWSSFLQAVADFLNACYLKIWSWNEILKAVLLSYLAYFFYSNAFVIDPYCCMDKCNWLSFCHYILNNPLVQSVFGRSLAWFNCLVNHEYKHPIILYNFSCRCVFVSLKWISKSEILRS